MTFAAGYDNDGQEIPTSCSLERVVARLENAQFVTMFSNGRAAIAAVASTLRFGDLVLADESIDGSADRWFEQIFHRFGVTVEYVDLSDRENYSQIERRPPAMVWVGSPTTPLLKIIDIPALAAEAQRVSASLVVDNSLASSYSQCPLQLGASLSLLGTTNNPSGNPDLLVGAVCTNEYERQIKLTDASRVLGLALSFSDSRLIEHGMRTLAVRMERHEQNALALARYLETLSSVEWVRYPFLPSHPQFNRAARQMRGGSGLVTVCFACDEERTLAALRRLRLFRVAPYLGGVESLACHPASMTHASMPREHRERLGITGSLVQFSVGLEHCDDVSEDIREAFEGGERRVGSSFPLGAPLPRSSHAVSVSMPQWDDIVGYEENAPEVVAKLRTGYPRFKLHPAVEELSAEYRSDLGTEDEVCFVFPSEVVAERAVQFVQRQAGIQGRTVREPALTAAFFPQAAGEVAKSFWQHAGEIVSSRRAVAALNRGRARERPMQVIRDRLAAEVGESPDRVFCYVSGMAAVNAALRSVLRLGRGHCTIQFGFPYIDTLKLQEKTEAGAMFFPRGTELEEFEKHVRNHPPAAVVCEFPANPLFGCADLRQLSSILRKYDVPLIIDDTIATAVNVDLRPFADVIVTSLTKTFSGAGNVMAGSVIVNSRSPHSAFLHNAIRCDYEDLLWDGDLEVLERNSRDFVSRIRRMNGTAERLCDYLRSHPRVAKLYYPKTTDRANYDVVRKVNGGYGSLLSLTLRGGESAARVFYNSLSLCKGPSFGTNFTLLCPYTLLAHYRELDWAERCGVPRSLLRVSIGLEEETFLRQAFEEAFRQVSEWEEGLHGRSL